MITHIDYCYDRNRNINVKVSRLPGENIISYCNILENLIVIIYLFTNVKSVMTSFNYAIETGSYNHLIECVT